jgi:hypothetical protein
VNVTLLGPQRYPTVGQVAAARGFDGPVATITAGWQEREAADGELSELLGGRDVNLLLYRRWLDVQERDPGFAAGERRTQGVLDELQDIYLLRLDHALQAVYSVQRRSGSDRLRPVAVADAIAAVRDLDAGHLRRIGEVRDEFYAAWQPHSRPVIARHRDEIGKLLGQAAAVVITGGHVGVLADALHLFNVAAALHAPVIAWSAGAMVLTERIVLFNDRAPQGPGHPEVHGAGLSVLPGVVVLPQARLLLDDAPRMAALAGRFAPARCLLLEPGSEVRTGPGGELEPPARMLASDGRVTALEAA